MSDVQLKKRKEGLTQQAYKQLKSMILSHRLKAGMIFNEAQLQEVLGIGRTPVREAVLQLAKEDFLIIHPRRGIEVARISPKRIRDIFQIRSLLEPQILRSGMGLGKLDKAWLTHMREEFSRFAGSDFDIFNRDTVQLSTLDNEFHMGIMNSIDNYYATELMAGFQDYLTLFRAGTTIDLIRFGPSNQEHIKIIDFMLNDDIEAACKNLEDHLARSYEEAVNIVMNMPI